jgi:hypothetical protein
MKIRDLTKDQLLSVPCPTCGAAINERCELNTGDPRNEPHRDRKLIAARWCLLVFIFISPLVSIGFFLRMLLRMRSSV